MPARHGFISMRITWPVQPPMSWKQALHKASQQACGFRVKSSACHGSETRHVCSMRWIQHSMPPPGVESAGSVLVQKEGSKEQLATEQADMLHAH